MYAAKFKMKTVARVFKLGGNSLNKPLGVKAKSIVGVDESHISKVYDQHGVKYSRNIPGILFDRYHKIPKPGGNKERKD
jgi:hypothetical protein